MWMQHEITLPPKARGFHLITREVLGAIPEVERLRVGLLHLFLCHTSASLSVNENADPDVPVDLEMALNRVVPETLPYVHTLEGPDDSPAHMKASLVGCSLTIRAGNLAGNLPLRAPQPRRAATTGRHAPRRGCVTHGQRGMASRARTTRRSEQTPYSHRPCGARCHAW